MVLNILDKICSKWFVIHKELDKTNPIKQESISKTTHERFVRYRLSAPIWAIDHNKISNWLKEQHNKRVDFLNKSKIKKFNETILEFATNTSC